VDDSGGTDGPEIRVLVQARRPLLRLAVQRALDQHPATRLLGAVATPDELVIACQRHRPAAVVLEPGSHEALVAARATGARCVGLRDLGAEDGRMLPPQPAAAFDAQLTSRDSSMEVVNAVCGYEGQVTHDTADPPALSDREIEVLRHVAAGRTSAEAARLLGISPKTVAAHRQRILGKLGVQSAAHAVAVAHEIGALPMPTA
jgi:DNA-binding NarL/FixJ family response regulator